MYSPRDEVDEWKGRCRKIDGRADLQAHIHLLLILGSRRLAGRTTCSGAAMERYKTDVDTADAKLDLAFALSCSEAVELLLTSNRGEVYSESHTSHFGTLGTGVFQ